MSVTDTSAGDFRAKSGLLSPNLVPVKIPFEGSWLEILLVAVWFFATAADFPGMGPVRYLCLALFMASLVWNREFLRPYFGHLWFLFLFPAWVGFSVLWSPNSSAALKFGIMHALDVMMMIYIAIRLSPHQIIKALFYAYIPVSLIVIAHLPQLGPYNTPIGFTEKNLVANRMFFMFVACLYMIFAERANWLEKGAALFFMPLTFLALFKVESATSLVMAILAFGVMTIIGTFWRAVAKIQAASYVLMVALLAMMIGGVIVAMSIFTQGPVNAFLDAVGKDATLTGRTELWDYGAQLIRDNPVMGIGAEGFWQLGRGDAESWLEYFHKAAGTRFSFHNSYIETAVHLGLVGAAFLLIGEAFVVYRLFANWFRKQDLAMSFFLILGVLALARSFTESDLYNVFEMNKIILFVGGLSAMSFRHVLAPSKAIRQNEQGGFEVAEDQMTPLPAR